VSVDDLRAIDVSRLSDQLMTLLTDPTSDLQAALVLYGMIALLVLIVLVTGIVVLMGTPDEDDELDFAREAGAADESAYAVPEVGEHATASGEPAHSSPPLSPLVIIGVIGAVAGAVWVLAGFTTSSNAGCAACHVVTVHSDATKGSDPHGGVDCVSCHEPGGGFGRYVTDVPSRMLHFFDGASGLSVHAGYGRVASSACSSCHATGIAGVTVNKDNGVRMSHQEPLAVSARCLDCHKPVLGAVTRQTVGMSSCLQCHDNVTAPSECSTCHDKQAAAAARARTTDFAKAQVVDIRCGGCHDEVAECDSCHGVRMPHSLAFKANQHARAGAADFWFNGGQSCAGSECHAPTRRPCTKCHTPLLGRGHPASHAQSHQGATASACACHDFFGLANPKSRDFCELCHSVDAIKESAR